ncbi:MAG: addiction module protein [Acidobacteriota bacterium]
MTLIELEAAALELDLPSRAHLAERLLHSLEDPSGSEIDELWLDEAIRRDRAIDAGELGETPAVEVFQELKARLK